MGNQADKVSHASLSSIYVKAQELDRGQNEQDAPTFAPPGSAADASSHASTYASDVQTRASNGADVETHASAHAGDAQTHSSDAWTHATE